MKRKTISLKESRAACNKVQNRLLVIIILAAFGLRIYGISFGLPYIYTSDAETAFIDPAIRFISTGDWNPHWFGHPGSTVMYLLSLLYMLYYAIGRVVGASPNLDAFVGLFQSNPTNFYLIGRTAMAVLGTLTVLLVCQVTARVYDKKAGVVAACFLAVSPLHHHWSQIARTDIPVTFLMVLVAFFCLRIYEERHVRYYLLAGLFAGLAIATKYPAVVVIPAIVLAHFLGQEYGNGSIAHHGGKRKLMLSLAFVLVGFCLGAPFWFVELRTAVKDMIWEHRDSHLGANRFTGVKNYLWYVTTPLREGLSLPVEVLAGLGVLDALRRRAKEELLLVFFPIAYLLLIGSASLRWDRWAIPLLPFMAVLAGGATMRLVDKIATFGGMRKRFDMVLVVVVLLVSVGPAYEIVGYDYRISQEDTRTLCKSWVESHIAPGTKMGQDCYSGPIWTELFDVTKVFSLSDWPLEYYRNEGFEYLLVSSYMYDRYFAEAQKYPKNVEFYRRLFKEGELVQEFKPNPKNRPGPTIRVYRIR